MKEYPYFVNPPNDDVMNCFYYLEEHARQIIGRSCELRMMLEEFRETDILKGMARKQRQLILDYVDEVILDLIPWSSYRISKKLKFSRLRMLLKNRCKN